MPFICLEELPHLLDDIPLWSARRRALAQFKRADFLGDKTKPLVDEIRTRIFEETANIHNGPIFVLANLRYFGFQMNPIAIYYCYSEDTSKLEYLVAEVNNTPWDERYSYVLKAQDTGVWLQTKFQKLLHVSPFNPMDMTYHWRSNLPGSRLVVHLKNFKEKELMFDASLSLKEQPFDAWNLNLQLLRYPFMTINVGLAIYWQALKLFLKGVPLHAHPKAHSSEVAND